MPNYWSSKLFSVGFASQTAYDAEDAVPSYTWLLAEMPSISFARDVETLDLGLPSDGVAPQTVAGSKHGGTFTLSMPLRGQASGYDATGAIAVNPEMTLLADLVGGSQTVAPQADFVAASGDNDANTVEAQGGKSSVAGAFHAIGNASTKAASLVGYVQTVAGQVYTTFEDSTLAPAATDDDLFGSYTVYPAGNQPTARSFKIVGKEATQGIVLMGCIPENGSISLENGKVPMLEITYRFTDYKYDSTSEGLQTATAYTRLPPVLGSKKGRVLLGGGVKESGAGSAQTGTVNTEGTCGIGSFKVDIACEVYEIPCHGAQQGVSSVFIGKRNITASFTVPHQDAYVTDGGDSKFGESLADQKAWSISLMLGSTAGQIFSILIPAGVVTAQPDMGDVDGIQAFTLEFQPVDYTGDSSSANSGDSPFRIGFA
jgi:hypothetical protein